MKFLILAILAAFLFNLAHAEAKVPWTVLEHLNNKCGDTWCESSVVDLDFQELNGNVLGIYFVWLDAESPTERDSWYMNCPVNRYSLATIEASVDDCVDEIHAALKSKDLSGKHFQ